MSDITFNHGPLDGLTIKNDGNPNSAAFAPYGSNRAAWYEEAGIAFVFSGFIDLPELCKRLQDRSRRADWTLEVVI